MAEDISIVYDHVCVDVETTGLDSRVDEVVEITAKEYNLSGKIGKSITRLCRPESGFIPKAASDVHGILYEEVKNEKCYLKDKIREEFFNFIGKRTVTGHNIEKFDSKFIKIVPVKMVDTLILSRQLFPGGSHKLGAMCNKMNIPYEKKSAHRSEYDVNVTIQLHLKLHNLLMKRAEKESNLPVFTEISEKIKVKKVGVVPTDDDLKLFHTQAYSYSRINTFHICPFKWYMLYIKKMKEPDRDYLTIGKVCHKIAEEAGKWCYKQNIANKIIVYKGADLTFDPWIIFSDPSTISALFPGCKGLYELVYQLDKAIADYERVSMPERDVYEKIINETLVKMHVTDNSMIGEIRYIMGKFYLRRDLSTSIDGVLITEKQIAFDKDWKILSDFYANNVFFRGIIDVIKYDNKTITITDYKSSRTMMTPEELKHDMQLKIYAMMVFHFLPRNSYNRLIIKIDYIRFSKEISYEVENIEEFIDEAKQWINNSVKLIEENIINKDGTAFQPNRNEYCGQCFLSEEGICPLFNMKFINDIDDPFNFDIRNAEDCVSAFKKAEVLGAEYTNLMKKCKEFVKTTDVPIVIDERAKLGLYTKQGIDISAEKFALLMLSKNFKITDFISTFGVTKTSLEKIQKRLKITLSDMEIESISEKTQRIEFKALTPEELDDYLNV